MLAGWVKFRPRINSYGVHSCTGHGRFETTFGFGRHGPDPASSTAWLQAHRRSESQRSLTTSWSLQLGPAGILFHESLFQYYPADQQALADAVRNKKLLGFSDIDTSEEPHAITRSFLGQTVPTVIERTAERWAANRDALVAYAKLELDRKELYRAIGSPAAEVATRLDDDQF